MRKFAIVVMFLFGSIMNFASSAHAEASVNQIAVAYSPKDNRYMACYANSANDLKCRLVTAAGEVTGSELTVSWNTCINPAIAYDSDQDMFLVVWAEYISGSQFLSLKVRLVTAECQLSGSEITLLSDGDTNLSPRVVYSPNSQRYVVVYSFLGTSIRAQFMNADASLDGTALTVIDGSAISYSRVENPNVAFDSVNNRFLIAGLVWGGTPVYGEHGVIVDDEETPAVYAGPFSIVGYSTFLYPPALAFDHVNERFLAIWEVYTGSGHELWGQLINTDGTLYGTNWKINDDREVYFANDAVYKEVDDRYLVVWNNCDNINPNELHAQEVENDGGNYGDEFFLASPTYSFYLALSYNTLMDNTLVAYSNTSSNSAPGFLVTPEVPSADLGVEVEGPDTGLIDDSLTYTVTITNFGSDNATEASVTIDVPDGVTFVDAQSSRGSTEYIAPSLFARLGTLESGDEATVSLEINPDETGLITVGAAVASDVLDPDASNNSDSKDTLISQSFLVAPGQGTTGTEIEITGEGFGAKKGKVLLAGAGKPVSLKVLSWNEEDSGVIRALVKKAPPSGICDVVVVPKDPKGAEPLIEPDGFEIMEPDITACPDSGAAGQTITITADFLGTKKGKVYIEYTAKGKLKRKSCKVLAWPSESEEGSGSAEIDCVVPKVPAGAWTLVVLNKVGEDTTPFTVSETP